LLWSGAFRNEHDAVGAPDRIGPRDGQILKQIREFGVPRVGNARAGPTPNGLGADLAA
jgi:hypothetical protein